jgi:tRNA A-37 threonylcarbamoyl transferase component Bud32
VPPGSRLGTEPPGGYRRWLWVAARSSSPTGAASLQFALLVYKDLTDHDFDAFMDNKSIASGDFEQVILSQIESREHFVVLLQPHSLDRIGQKRDWMRLEIAHALAHDRNVVPLTADGFEFNHDLSLPAEVSQLPRFNALNIPWDYFDAAMERLRTEFLSTPSKPTVPPPPKARRIGEEVQQALGRQARYSQRPIVGQPRAGPPLLSGRYELGELLGRGGMAEVRRAVDQRLGRSVAVKQLRTDLARDPTFQARFRREAQSAAGLNHPTIVGVYDTGAEIDPLTGVAIPYVVMELVEGPTLRDVLKDGRKILPERALELTQGVLEALSYSHKAGIVHRDIKPANVMLTPNGGVKVMDFGIARAVADTSATMTQTAAVIGTAQYLSPEQARGETVDARSDLYSAGCLLYELLVGRPPFVGDSPVSVAYQHVRVAPLPPSQLDPEIGPEIDAVVLKALAKDPDDRYQSAREMKADISRLLAGQETTAQ